jgi:F1F0 ATPase subunit 2
MAMNETVILVLAGRRGLARRVFLRRPLVDGAQGPFVETAGALFLGSLLLRTSIALAGFYFVSGGHWERLLACLLGFVIARLIVTRLTPQRKTQLLAQEASHAP